jgi:hypothetical protein
VLALCPAKVPSAFDGFTAEDLLGGQLVVSSAKHAKIFGVTIAAKGPRKLVIELEEGVRFATAAVRRNVRAPKAIAVEDFAARVARDVAWRLGTADP